MSQQQQRQEEEEEEEEEQEEHFPCLELSAAPQIKKIVHFRTLFRVHAWNNGGSWVSPSNSSKNYSGKLRHDITGEYVVPAILLSDVVEDILGKNLLFNVHVFNQYKNNQTSLCCQL